MAAVREEVTEEPRGLPPPPPHPEGQEAQSLTIQFGLQSASPSHRVVRGEPGEATGRLEPMLGRHSTLQACCHRQCEGYPGIKVQDLSSSFRNRLVFCAIVHHHRLDLLGGRNRERLWLRLTWMGLSAIIGRWALISKLCSSCQELIKSLGETAPFRSMLVTRKEIMEKGNGQERKTLLVGLQKANFGICLWTIAVTSSKKEMWRF
ncbi:uncharacterized protein LOC134292393 [Anolis carolinensis]|uniref:uncharacterized protein LOC134292393 n=1 Tax=Anolis carolinensis TaxID=28377 RepID=UPI002F2B1B67